MHLLQLVLFPVHIVLHILPDKWWKIDSGSVLLSESLQGKTGLEWECAAVVAWWVGAPNPPGGGGGVMVGYLLSPQTLPFWRESLTFIMFLPNCVCPKNTNNPGSRSIQWWIFMLSEHLSLSWKCGHERRLQSSYSVKHHITATGHECTLLPIQWQQTRRFNACRFPKYGSHKSVLACVTEQYPFWTMSHCGMTSSESMGYDVSWKKQD